MCGIAAIVTIHETSFHGIQYGNVANKLLEAVKHRGPNGSNLIRIPNEEYMIRPMIFLGHSRLAIVGGDEAIQPIKWSKGKATFYLVHNGEIYNHVLIKKEMIESGICTQKDFSLGSDSEVLLACLVHCGIEWTTQRVRGMFAFVLVETVLDCSGVQNVRKITLCRDVFGIKPLCFAMDKRQEVMLIASEVNAIPRDCGLDASMVIRDVLPRSFVEITFRRDDVGWSWSLQEQVFNNCLFEQVKQIEQASQQVHQQTGQVHQQIEKQAIQKWQTDIRSTLTEAVSIRIPPERKFCVLLSGGLDSSLVAAIAADLLHPEPLHTFTISFEDGRISNLEGDRLYARRVADAIPNIIHEEVVFSFKDGMEALPKVIRCCETTDATILRAGVPLFLLSQHIASKGFQVVLCGEGADEVMAGYRLFERYDPCSPRDCEEFAREYQRRLMHIDTSELQRVDRCTSAHGLEARVPFLDLGFVNASMKIPMREKMSHRSLGRIQKYVLRRAFDGESSASKSLLPDCVLYREKEQFADGIGRSWISRLQQHAATESVSGEEAEKALYEKLFRSMDNVEARQGVVESRNARRRDASNNAKKVSTGRSQSVRWHPVRSDRDLQSMKLTKKDAGHFLQSVLGWSSGELTPTLLQLNRLIASMLERVPFHNLTLLTRERRPPTMTEIKHDMMSGLGGPCSVVNSFFAVLLDLLGFGPHVYLLSCRIDGRDDCHVAILLQMKGVHYFVDVANAKPYDRAVPLNDNSVFVALDGSFRWGLRYEPQSGRMELCHSDQAAISFDPASTVTFGSFRRMIQRSRTDVDFGPFLRGLRFCLFPPRKLMAVRDACIYDGISMKHKTCAVAREDIKTIAKSSAFAHIPGFVKLVNDSINVLDEEHPNWFETSQQFLMGIGVPYQKQHDK